eukprot:TRINITY_DN1572_c1_g1_i1.p1 TRINITY_DN1572_c1_g1~~TRINITY_DN1572_c1_g1_i1.p1  ORF type:complete len:286 (+),score=67.86 TRINITY_DN1572_c1_g1_i1:111-968(+)
MAANSGDDYLSRLNEHENFVLGMTTGVVEQVSSQPILFWKNSYQQGLPFTANPMHLYRGILASCCNMAALTAIQTMSAGMFQKAMIDATGGAGSDGVSAGIEITSALLGGAVSGPVCCALELTMIQQQRFGGSMPSTLGRIVQNHGAAGLMRGLFPSTAREALFTAGYLGTVPATRKYLDRSGFFAAAPRVGEAVAVIGAGMACGALTQPFDTAKTCMQGDMERKRYRGFLETLRTLSAEYGGVKAMYRGYLWRSCNIVLDFFLLDFLAIRLAPMMYPEKLKPCA